MRIEDIKIGQKVQIIGSCTYNKCEFYRRKNCPFIDNIGKTEFSIN